MTPCAQCEQLRTRYVADVILLSEAIRLVLHLDRCNDCSGLELALREASMVADQLEQSAEALDVHEARHRRRKQRTNLRNTRG